MTGVLGIDSSTQGCSAVVLDLERMAIVADAAVNYGEHLPQYGSPSGFIPNGAEGEVLANPLMWLDALDLLFSELSQRVDLKRIRAVCGAGQQHGSVYLNADWFTQVSNTDPKLSLSEQLKASLSRPLSPIWMDHSTSEECEEITRAVGGSRVVSERSGSVATERFTGPQIRRFYKRFPQAYAETARIHLVSSFLASVLAGADAPVDTGDGAGMNLMNIQELAWDSLLMEATAPGLSGKLPFVVGGNHIVGTVASYFQKRYGFSSSVPVVVFTGDNPASLVGMGAGQSGQAVISLGTSDTFFAAMPAVCADSSGCGHVFGNPLGGTLSLQCFTNGSLAREAVRDRFGMDWQAFSEALASTPPGNEGRLMLPLFTAESSPRLHLKEPLLEGDDVFLQGKDPASWVRACVEGQFINMRLQTRWMGLEPSRMLLTGGAARNDAIAQVVADIFQCRVERLSIANSVALGSAMRAAAAMGLASMETLVAAFCQVESGSGRTPNAACGETYQKMIIRMDCLIRGHFVLGTDQERNDNGGAECNSGAGKAWKEIC